MSRSLTVCNVSRKRQVQRQGQIGPGLILIDQSGRVESALLSTLRLALSRALRIRGGHGLGDRGGGDGRGSHHGGENHGCWLT